MIFQRPDLVPQVIKRLDDDPLPQTEQQATRERVLNQGLMDALSFNEPEFVKLLLDSGATPAGLMPRDPSKYASAPHNSKLAKLPPVALALEDLYESGALRGGRHIERMVYYSKSGTRGGREADLTERGLRKYNVVHMERLMSRCVGGDFALVRNWHELAITPHSPESAKRKANMIATHMLFVRLGRKGLGGWCVGRQRRTHLLFVNPSDLVFSHLPARPCSRSGPSAWTSTAWPRYFGRLATRALPTRCWRATC